MNTKPEFVREDIRDAAFNRQSADRLLHMEEVDQATLDGYLSARGRSRQRQLRASTFMGALAAVQPWFSKLAMAADGAAPAATGSQRTDHGRPRQVRGFDRIIFFSLDPHWQGSLERLPPYYELAIAMAAMHFRTWMDHKETRRPA